MLFRRLADREPAESMKLVAFLGRRENTDDAFEIYERSWKQCPPELVAPVAVALANSGSPADPRKRMVAKSLEQLAAEHPESTLLLRKLADLKLASQQWPAAIERYEQVIQQDPEDAAAKNNLAWLFALRSTRTADAEQLIDDAIRIAGPQALLLNTKSLVLMSASKPREAIAVLRQAISERETAVARFRLALAYRMVDDRTAAARELQRAAKLGLNTARIQPLEQKNLESLRAWLRSGGTPSNSTN